MKKGKTSAVWLFLGTFASAFLLFAGLAGLGILFAPQLVSALQANSQTIPTPTLPLSPDREDVLLDTKKLAGKQLYPPLPETTATEEGNWIRIPSIGVNVPLVLSPSMADEDVLKTLTQGAALYPNGINPGVLGNVFVSAHSTGNPWLQGAYRFAFLRINEVKAGNVIHIDYNKTRYTYKVTGQEIIIPTADYRVVSDRPVPTVTLMACWPLWSTEKRMLTRAELTNVTKLTPTPV
jgi:LPXTG-site transpeptidase (sortase) family protein